MDDKQVSGTLIYREWNADRGLEEIGRRFESLDEFFTLCMTISDPKLIDRVVISGVDAQGTARTLIFGFRGITTGDGDVWR